VNLRSFAVTSFGLGRLCLSHGIPEVDQEDRQAWVAGKLAADAERGTKWDGGLIAGSDTGVRRAHFAEHFRNALRFGIVAGLREGLLPDWDGAAPFAEALECLAELELVSRRLQRLRDGIEECKCVFAEFCGVLLLFHFLIEPTHVEHHERLEVWLLVSGGGLQFLNSYDERSERSRQIVVVHAV
jgi:hypothetical protein